MPNWFVVTAGREIGPFTSQQLKSLVRDGKLAPTDLVRREDQLIPCRASMIKGLFEGKPLPPALPPARIVLDLPPASSGTRSARISLNGTPAGVVGGENADLLSFEVPPGEHVLDMQGAGLRGQETILVSPGQTLKCHVVITRRGIHLSGEDAPRTRSLFQSIKFGCLALSVLGFVALFGSCVVSVMLDPAVRDATPAQVQTESPQTPALEATSARSDSPNRESKWGYIDRTGQIVIPCQFDRCGEFSDGLAAVSQNGKWGFIDQKGTLVIPFKFNGAGSFSEGLAGVEDEEGNACIDKKGQIVFRSAYSISQFSNGLAIISTSGDGTQVRKFGFMNRSGTTVVPPRFNSVSKFAEDRAIVSIDEGTRTLSGMIDASGRYLIEPTAAVLFGSLGGEFIGYSEGMCVYHDDILKLSGYIDLSGKPVLPASRIKGDFSCGAFSEGLARVARGVTDSEIRRGIIPDGFMKYGYIDPTGELVIPRQFTNAQDFSEGLAAVQIDDSGRYGYIDRKGRLVISLRYDVAGRFTDGIAVVREGKQYGLINKTGEYVAELRASYISDFSEGLAPVSLP